MPFLKEMLYEAALWNEHGNRPSIDDLLSVPDLKKILEDWGNRQGDFALLMLDSDDQPVGAVWYRFWTKSNHSFGFVNENIPELGIAIKKEHRGKGLGTFLMKKIFDNAKEKDITKISLSVIPKNFALKLYQKLGFYKVDESDDAWTMVYDIKK